MEDVELRAPHGRAAQSRVAVVYIPTSIIPAWDSAANQTTPCFDGVGTRIPPSKRQYKNSNEQEKGKIGEEMVGLLAFPTTEDRSTLAVTRDGCPTPGLRQSRPA